MVPRPLSTSNSANANDASRQSFPHATSTPSFFHNPGSLLWMASSGTGESPASEGEPHNGFYQNQDNNIWNTSTSDERRPFHERNSNERNASKKEALEHLHRYETMVKQQEDENEATLAYLRPCFERIEEIILEHNPTQGTDEQYTSSIWTRSVQFVHLRIALGYVESRPPHQEFLKTDRQLMMVLRLLTDKSVPSVSTPMITPGGNLNRQNESHQPSLTWAEVAQCYKSSISGMQTLENFPLRNGSCVLRSRIRDRTVTLMSLFAAPSTFTLSGTNRPQVPYQLSSSLTKHAVILESHSFRDSPTARSVAIATPPDSDWSSNTEWINNACAIVVLLVVALVSAYPPQMWPLRPQTMHSSVDQFLSSGHRVSQASPIRTDYQNTRYGVASWGLQGQEYDNSWEPYSQKRQDPRHENMPASVHDTHSALEPRGLAPANDEPSLNTDPLAMCTNPQVYTINAGQGDSSSSKFQPTQFSRVKSSEQPGILDRSTGGTFPLRQNPSPLSSSARPRQQTFSTTSLFPVSTHESEIKTNLNESKDWGLPVVATTLGTAAMASPLIWTIFQSPVLTWSVVSTAAVFGTGLSSLTLLAVRAVQKLAQRWGLVRRGGTPSTGSESTATR